MDIIEKVDPSSLQLQSLQHDTEKSIFYFDLTVARTNTEIPNKSVQPQQQEPNLIIRNCLDNHQQGDDMMMKNHAATIPSSTVPADKHPQISPSEFKHWIKTHSNDVDKTTGSTTVTRKRFVLSTVSYTEEDGNSSGDDDITPPTPTNPEQSPHLSFLPEPKHRNTNGNHSTVVISEHSAENNKILLHSQAKYARGKEGHFSTVDNQPPSRTSPAMQPKIKNPNLIVNQPNMVSSTNADQQQYHNSKQNKKLSWFRGLFRCKKKSNSSNNDSNTTLTTKKTGISGFFSRTINNNNNNNNQKSTASSISTTVNNNNSSLARKLFPSPSSNINSDKPSINVNRNLTSSGGITKKSKKKTPEKVVDSVMKKMPIGKSSSRKVQLSTSPKPQPLVSRYPVNTERAIYQLSHIKLGNSKIPLQQQVVISNMIYWYVTMTERQQQQQQLYYQQQQQKYHYAFNKRKQVYFNNVYQATYQSFEPPAPGRGMVRQHYYQHVEPYYMPPNHSSSPHSPHVLPPSNSTLRLLDITATKYATTTTTAGSGKGSNNPKKKYRPVCNTKYEPFFYLENNNNHGHAINSF